MNLILRQRLFQVLAFLQISVFSTGQISQAERFVGDSETVLTSVSYASVHAMNCLGKHVRFTGRVVRILESGIPLEVLMTSGGYRWIAQFYETDSIPDGVIAPHARIVVEGVLFTIDDRRTLIGGTRQGLIVVMALKAYRLKSKR